MERFWMKLEEVWVEELNGNDCGFEICSFGFDCDTFIECLLYIRFNVKYIRVKFIEFL